MSHDIPLLTTMAYGLAAALFFALIARKLGLQPLIGYLVAGIIIGPHTPGFIGDQRVSEQLAEVGVILLMFGVGLHFHIKDLYAVRAVAIPGALVQSLIATLCGVAVAGFVGWTLQAGLVLGIATAVASTVVLLRVLNDHGIVNSSEGHTAVGWLLVEDIITVIVLVLLPALAAGSAAGSSFAATLGLTIIKLCALYAVVVIAGGALIPKFLVRVARLRSQELFTLSVLVLSISMATISYTVFGSSMALGAFLAGMIVGQSAVSFHAASNIIPMRDAFTVLFFVSVGMLFDYQVLLNHPWLTLGVLLIILIVKPITALLIVIFLGHPLRTALAVAAGLAQIGEFSFILGSLGTQLKLMPAYGQSVLVASAIISIALNAFIFKYFMSLERKLAKIPLLQPWLKKEREKRLRSAHSLDTETEIKALGDKGRRAILIGYGPVGRTVHATFERLGINPLIIESNIDIVLELKAAGKAALHGDATKADILKTAGIADADFLAVTTPEIETNLAIIKTASSENSEIKIFTRCNYESDRSHLENAGANVTASAESLAAAAMAEALLSEKISSKVRVRREVKKIQAEVEQVLIR